jgi:hypothetical protein
MTLEEAIKNREECLQYLEGIGQKASPDCVEAVRWSVKALNALRPVSREQVEKVWRGEWLHDPETGYEHCDKCSHTISLDDYLNRKPPLFCEMCGDAKTAEAVEMVMERMEKLYNA